MAAAAQASLDDGMSAFKALSGVKSVKDAFELQSSFARSALEKSVAESGKLTDASFKLTEQALAPIAARVTVAVEKFGKAG
jgi:phasin family protein